MQLSEDQIEQLAQASFDADTTTNEQLMENIAKYKESISSEEGMAAFMKNLKDTFDSVDADSDGLLTEAEYIEYNSKLWAHAIEKGYHAPTEMTETMLASLKTVYEIVKTLDDGDGMSFDALMLARKHIQGKIMEKRGITM